uniref:Putative secreted protein n=1 Tax=Ixodes ricinus TaxID=34613 RepID=A0A6B0UPH5_IXORI
MEGSFFTIFTTTFLGLWIRLVYSPTTGAKSSHSQWRPSGRVIEHSPSVHLRVTWLESTGKPTSRVALTSERVWLHSCFRILLFSPLDSESLLEFSFSLRRLFSCLFESMIHGRRLSRRRAV